MATIDSRVNYDYYSGLNFFSGSQTTVWFGNVYLDDIHYIEWERHQVKRPVYGYASQQFDAVSKGIVIVHGSFAINFRQAGYIPSVMNKIANLYSDQAVRDDWDTISDTISAHLKNGTFGPKTVDEIKAIANSDNFYGLAKSYEDIVWGPGIPVGDSNEMSSLRTMTSADVSQHDKIPGGFSIMVAYGNRSIKDKTTLNDYLQSTYKTINGVHIVSDGQLIRVGGEPVLERYEFIARGTDEQLSSLM
jgi:hypothetical protein